LTASTEITSVTPAIELLYGRLSTLEAQATEKSVLFAQARMRDNSLTANWYEIQWYGSKAAKTRRMTKKLIRKQKSDYGYNWAVLFKLTQPWEEDMVWEVEQVLRDIRKEVAFISKAIGLLNHLVKECK
jgi:hypothetical protein